VARGGKEVNPGKKMYILRPRKGGIGREGSEKSQITLEASSTGGEQKKTRNPKKRSTTPVLGKGREGFYSRKVAQDSGVISVWESSGYQTKEVGEGQKSQGDRIYRPTDENEEQ